MKIYKDVETVKLENKDSLVLILNIIWLVTEEWLTIISDLNNDVSLIVH